MAGVITDMGRDFEAMLKAGVVSDPIVKYFRIGEGGHVAGTPIVPDPSFTRLQADGILLTGTLKIINGSEFVVGNGTLFTTEVTVDGFIQIDVDGIPCQVKTIFDDENIELYSAYGGVGSPLIFRYGGYLTVGSIPWYTFVKNLDLADLTFNGPASGSMTARCLTDTSEANDDGYGDAPEFYEIGIYLSYPGNPDVMIAYVTFNKQIKTSLKQLIHNITLSW